MPFIYEVTNTLQYGTIAMANVMHVQATSGAQATLSQINAAVTAMASFYTFQTSIMPSGLTWQTGTKVMEFEDSTPNVRTFIGNTPSVASATGGTGALPSQCAVCVNWLTGLPGRSHRGRTFVGPLATSALTSGNLSTSAKSTVLSGAAALRSSLSGLSTPFTLLVWSKTLSQAFAINGHTTDGLVDTLRSRKY